MNITEFKHVMPILLKHKIVPFLWGSQGIGKTQVVRQITKQMNPDNGFVHLNLGAVADVGDLLGLLTHKGDGTVEHARPEWFPTSGEGVIFLDEFNRAHPDILQAMFTFVLEGRLHRHRLPAGWKIVVAGNYENNNFTVTSTSDDALRSRFCHIDFKPTVAEFCSFAEDQGFIEIASFIKRYPQMLETQDSENTLNTAMMKPNRRAWLDLLGPLGNEEMPYGVRLEVYGGIVGDAAALTFLTDLEKNLLVLSGREVLDKWTSVKVKDKYTKLISDPSGIRFDLLNLTVDEIMNTISDKKKLTDTQLMNFKGFLLVIPNELLLTVLDRIKSLPADVGKARYSILEDPEICGRLLLKK